jgi:hypothetical protein
LARKYSVSSGLTSLAASTTKVACQIATGSTVTATVLGFDIAFDSTATGAGAVPIQVQLARPTAAGSGGSTQTPAKFNNDDIAAVVTGRKNDTTAGASPTVIKEWLVSPTTGFSYQFPLGRELVLAESDFLELKLISQSGMTTCNYVGNIDFEE